jgi:hypothetical protein
VAGRAGYRRLRIWSRATGSSRGVVRPGRALCGQPEPPDIEDRQEGRKPLDRATNVLATIECVLEDDLNPAIASLQRSATIADAELEEQYQDWLRRRVL